LRSTMQSELSDREAQTSLDSARSIRRLRIFCRIIALALGAAQAWAARFTMNPDGVSYLDIGDAYWRRDWHNAINAYWSPLYSWILGFFLKVLKPSAYWEYPLVHLVNFFIYGAALACFDFFLANFIRSRRLKGADVVGLPEWYWWLFGYSLFLISSLILVGMSMVTPDICVSAFFYLASALLLRIATGSARMPTHLAFGIVLGLGYLAKAVMFPLAFVFLLVGFIASRSIQKPMARILIPLLGFTLVASPLITVVSHQKGRLTFGETGSWTYRFYVNGMTYWPTDSARFVHPIKSLGGSPGVYEFGDSVNGTFPPWYDPTYWSEGVKPKPTIKGELTPLLLATSLYIAVFLFLFLHVLAGAVVLYWDSEEPKLWRQLSGWWAIVVPAISTFLLYSLVHVETRFIPAQTTVFFLVLYSGVKLPTNGGWSRARKVAMRGVIGVSAAIVVLTVWIETKGAQGPIYYEAASELQTAGVLRGDHIGLMWNEVWNVDAACGSYVPRLLRLRVVSEVTNADVFWKLDRDKQQQTLETLRRTGIRAILARAVPEHQRAGWRNLGNTGFFVYLFPRRALQ
jgi:hypothetical protein